MNSRQPPSLAVWLLRKIGLTRQNEPLAGDLLEEFRNGRTAAWYWRQTTKAIVVAFCHRVWIFRLDLLALIAGWGTESGAVFALKMHGTPVALPYVLLGLSVSAAISLALWRWSYLHKWRDRGDSSEADFDRKFGTRYITLAFFTAFLMGDVLAAVFEDLAPVHSPYRLLLAWHLYWFGASCVIIIKSSPGRALGARPPDSGA